MRRPRPYGLSRPVGELERPRSRRGDAAAISTSPTESRVRVTFALIWGVAIRFLLIVALVWLGYKARFVVITVLISALLALALAPIVESLARRPWLGLTRRSRRSLSAFVVFILLGVVLFLVYIYLMLPFFQDVLELIKSLGAHSGKWSQYYATFQQWVDRLPPEAQNIIRQQDYSDLSATAARFVQSVVSTTTQWLSHAVELVLIPVLAFYLIVERRMLRREWAGLIPARYRRDALSISRATGRIMRDYIVANLILCIVAGVVVYVGLRILNMPYALSLSVVAGITRFVPVIGPIVGGIPVVLVALAQSLALGVGVLSFFTVLHLLESKLLLPKLIGHRLHISGSLVLIVLLLGGEFAGIIGMFLAAPIAALIRVLLHTYLLHTRRRAGSVTSQAAANGRRPD